MKQVIYSEHHRGIVEYPLMEKPKLENYSATAIGFFDKVINAAGYEKDMKEYNKWLSSPPIAQVRDEDREFFSVPRGKKEYKIEKLHVDADGNPATFYTVGYKLVATPIKEDRNLEPSQLQTSEPVNLKHGHNRRGKRSKEYTAWIHMKQRCLNPNHKRFSDYGGRGINVCERWVDSFDNFLSDMGYAPSKKHTLERLENDKGYEPNNCAWVTNAEQQHNTRQNVILEFNGKKMTMMEWARETGIDFRTIHSRLKAGWATEKILTTKTKSSHTCTSSNSIDLKDVSSFEQYLIYRYQWNGCGWVDKKETSSIVFTTEQLYNRYMRIFFPQLLNADSTKKLNTK
jgi:hypothetical protein